MVFINNIIVVDGFFIDERIKFVDKLRKHLSVSSNVKLFQEDFLENPYYKYFLHDPRNYAYKFFISNLIRKKSIYEQVKIDSKNFLCIVDSSVVSQYVFFNLFFQYFTRNQIKFYYSLFAETIEIIIPDVVILIENEKTIKEYINTESFSFLEYFQLLDKFNEYCFFIEFYLGSKIFRISDKKLGLKKILCKIFKQIK
jgi:deoxyadenosine/deoxycytidine kinase